MLHGGQAFGGVVHERLDCAFLRQHLELDGRTPTPVAANGSGRPWRTRAITPSRRSSPPPSTIAQTIKSPSQLRSIFCSTSLVSSSPLRAVSLPDGVATAVSSVGMARARGLGVSS